LHGAKLFLKAPERLGRKRLGNGILSKLRISSKNGQSSSHPVYALLGHSE
jgi:hypothetical protein